MSILPETLDHVVVANIGAANNEPGNLINKKQGKINMAPAPINAKLLLERQNQPQLMARGSNNSCFTYIKSNKDQILEAMHGGPLYNPIKTNHQEFSEKDLDIFIAAWNNHCIKPDCFSYKPTMSKPLL